MPTPIQIKLTTPCHENWSNMRPAEKGRYCAACQKTVVDFTQMNDGEILRYLKRSGATTVAVSATISVAVSATTIAVSTAISVAATISVAGQPSHASPPGQPASPAWSAQSSHPGQPAHAEPPGPQHCGRFRSDQLNRQLIPPPLLIGTIHWRGWQWLLTGLLLSCNKSLSPNPNPPLQEQRLPAKKTDTSTDSTTDQGVIDVSRMLALTQYQDINAGGYDITPVPHK